MGYFVAVIKKCFLALNNFLRPILHFLQKDNITLLLHINAKSKFITKVIANYSHCPSILNPRTSAFESFSGCARDIAFHPYAHSNEILHRPKINAPIKPTKFLRIFSFILSTWSRSSRAREWENIWYFILYKLLGKAENCKTNYLCTVCDNNLNKAVICLCGIS